jgi:hypothetical protein
VQRSKPLPYEEEGEYNENRHKILLDGGSAYFLILGVATKWFAL